MFLPDIRINVTSFTKTESSPPPVMLFRLETLNSANENDGLKAILAVDKRFLNLLQ